MRRLSPLVASVAVAVMATNVSAHAPSVVETASTSPDDAVVLDDPTLSRAIGATIDQPGEIDWYRMDLAAGAPLVVGMTAPCAQVAVASLSHVAFPNYVDLSKYSMDEAVARFGKMLIQLTRPWR